MRGIQLVELVRGREAIEPRRSVAVVFEKVEIAQVASGIGKTPGSRAGIGGYDGGFLVVIRIDQVGFAGLKIDPAIAKGRPNILRFVLVLIAA